MRRTLTAVMLAGRLRPSPLREALAVHELCLPVGSRGTLLDAWLERLGGIDGLQEIQVVVNTSADAEMVSASLADSHRGKKQKNPVVRVIDEPAPWRGAAGIVRDVTDGCLPQTLVLVCEGKRLPPSSIVPLVDAFQSAEQLAGVVGVCEMNEPAGTYLFTREVINLVPRIGYVDLKEQFLPSACRRGLRIVTARLAEAAWQLRDVKSYLAAVEQSLDGDGEQARTRVSERASVSGSAVLDGFCIIEPGAVIEDGAVVHDSVVLRGATVGGGAVVSRCVVGPLAVVEPRTRFAQTILVQPERTPQLRAVQAPRQELQRRIA